MAPTLSGGNVVCREESGAFGIGMACSQIAWCVGQRCLTSGGYTVGQRIFKSSYGDRYALEEAGKVVEILSDGMPNGSEICVIEANEGVHVESYRSHGRKITPVAQSAAEQTSQVQMDVTEPSTGRATRVFGSYDKSALPPQDSVLPIAAATDKLYVYHQGAFFRQANTAICIYNGLLGTEERDYAACYETSKLCEAYPEFCRKG